MAKAIPNPEPPFSGGNPREKAPRMGGTGVPAGLEPWDTDELLGKEAGTGAGSADVAALEAKNAELQSIVDELSQELEALQGRSESLFADRQKEYDSLIDEKNEMIRQLHMRVQELEQIASKPPTPKEEELIAMSEELERERCQLQQDRKKVDEEMQQLRDDSDVMNQEMRQMEVQMARERADLARQRAELQRLSEEVRHELERAEKDHGLSDRLKQLSQRHKDAVRGKTNVAPPRSS